MFRRQRNFIGLFLPFALVGFSISASQAFAQKARETLVYAPPSLSLSADQAVINACEGETTASSVHLNAKATSSSGNVIHYRWTTGAGRIVGDGPAVSWDLSGVK